MGCKSSVAAIWQYGSHSKLLSGISLCLLPRCHPCDLLTGCRRRSCTQRAPICRQEIDVRRGGCSLAKEMAVVPDLANHPPPGSSHGPAQLIHTQMPLRSHLYASSFRVKARSGPRAIRSQGIDWLFARGCTNTRPTL